MAQSILILNLIRDFNSNLFKQMQAIPDQSEKHFEFRFMQIG